jgi:hypothetical protein
MRTPVKLAAFGGALALAFTGALGLGAATGSPLSTDERPAHNAPGHGTPPVGASAEQGLSDKLPAGLAVSQSGYTLELADRVLPARPAVRLGLRIVTDDGAALREFDVSHDKQLHLILVRRDTTGFQHVHPKMTADGTWTVPVTLTPGDWRVFADFVPSTGPAARKPLTLGADLAVAGQYTPASLPKPSRAATVDGYQVSLDGDLTQGRDSTLAFTVTRGGQPVNDLQPYLGAYGHLVALRAGDLAYLHVHPEGEPAKSDTGGPEVSFSAAAPTAGTYRLFLDFKHDGQVRTAEFTLPVPAGAGSTDSATPPSASPSDAGSPRTKSTPKTPATEHSSDGHSH